MHRFRPVVTMAVLTMAVLTMAVLVTSAVATAAIPGMAEASTAVTVTMQTSASSVTFTGSVTLTGTMTEDDNQQPVGNSPLTVFEVDAYDNTTTQTVSTNSAGDWTATFTINSTSSLYAQSKDYSSNQAQATVTALAKISLKVPATVNQPYLLDPAKIGVAPNGTSYVLQTRPAGSAHWSDAPDTTGVWGSAPGTFSVRVVTSGGPVIARTTTAPVTVTVGTVQPPPWLKELNRYRALNDAAPVAEDPVLSKDDALHVRYMIKTGDFTHYESTKSKWYTPGGAEAGLNSDLAWNFPDPIMAWAGAPYHAMAELTKAGTLAGYATGGGYAALWVDSSTSMRPVTEPAYQFPANGTVTSLLRYSGEETPNPVATCPASHLGLGYGLPVIFGNQKTASKPTATLASNGKAVPKCVVNDVYSVFVIPLQPLVKHRTYHVAVYYNGKLQSRWQFKTS